MHNNDRVEVAQCRFTDKGSDADITMLESGMSFLQVKASMTMNEKLKQGEECHMFSRREIARRRLKAIAGADNPHSLITIFG
jgi:hypothetical protein